MEKEKELVDCIFSRSIEFLFDKMTIREVVSFLLLN